MRTPLLTPFISFSVSVLVAYGLLAATILAIVAGGVKVAHDYVDRNLIQTGELRRDTLTIDRGGAHTLDIELFTGFGETTIAAAAPAGGEEAALVMDYETNVVGLHPEASYAITDGLGSLIAYPSMQMGVPNLRRLENYENRWDVRLPVQMPMTLTTALGAGLVHLTPNGLDLNALTVEAGTGEVTVDLRGVWSRSFPVTVEAGNGEVTLLLPDDAGVRANVEIGLGDVEVHGLYRLGGETDAVVESEFDNHEGGHVESVYVNDAFATHDVLIDVTVEIGLGAVDLVVLPPGAEWPIPE